MIMTVPEPIRYLNLNNLSISDLNTIVNLLENNRLIVEKC